MKKYGGGKKGGGKISTSTKKYGGSKNEIVHPENRPGGTGYKGGKKK